MATAPSTSSERSESNPLSVSATPRSTCSYVSSHRPSGSTPACASKLRAAKPCTAPIASVMARRLQLCHHCHPQAEPAAAPFRVRYHEQPPAAVLGLELRYPAMSGDGGQRRR